SGKLSKNQIGKTIKSLLWPLKNKRNHATQRRGGFSPPRFVIEAIGRGIRATTLLRLFFKDHEREMRGINAPFNDYYLIRFDIAVHIYLNPTGSCVAFNPLAPFMINLLIRAGAAATSPRPVALSAQAPASTRDAAPSAQESVLLEPGKPVERELSGGGSHSYKITMISGQYLHVVVPQRGINVD